MGHEIGCSIFEGLLLTVHTKRIELTVGGESSCFCSDFPWSGMTLLLQGLNPFYDLDVLPRPQKSQLSRPGLSLYPMTKSQD